ncbi:DUF2953 domain-containing protein [Brevibacillus sp. GCM10020057]|uniref:DUF2953 domain-containing protein n=1 Tax=Brevibacillus sp. GCM10020057 TaxID=3317327 RepID=UPI00363471D8
MVWIILVVVVLMLLLFVTPVQITLFYGRVGENDHAVVEVSAWFRLIHRKYEIPMVFVKQSEAGPELVAKVETVLQKQKTTEKIKDLTRKQVNKWYHNYREILDKVHDLHPLFNELFRKIRCTRLEWHTRMGTGQAAETGALTGVVWGVKSLIVGVLSHSISLRIIPRLSVEPVWNQALIRTNFHCDLHLMLGHVLVVLAKMYVRLRKGRERKWRSAPSEA